MKGIDNVVIARMRVAWPGILAVGIAIFWLGVWGIFTPSPASLGMSHQAGLIKPRDISFVPSVSKLRQLFARIDYDLESVRNGERMVPPLYLAAVPSGMLQIKQPDERKRVFLRVMLPLVLKANERVRGQRDKLLTIKRTLAAGGRLSEDDRGYLKRMARAYGLRQPRIDYLLARVDVVPVSIALAQSAIESGWGTSRFVREGNAPFGQWTTAKYSGIVPMERPEGETYKIRAFKDLADSVRSYVHNINTHRAYRHFRASRTKMRGDGAQLDSLELIKSLKSYAEKGGKYISLLRQIIQSNELAPLDRARLGERVPRTGPDA